MKYIGTNYQRVDGIEKVKGEALYVDDIKYPGMLQISVVRSTIAKGKILNIDIESAMLPGVIGIYTAKDFPGDNSYGFPICDNQILSKGEVRYIGDAIAIVCAESRKVAKESVKKVNVTYERAEAVFTSGVSENHINKMVVKKNPEACKDYKDDIVLEMELSTKHQEHMYIEPEGAVASYEGEVLKIEAPMQSPLAAKGIICKVMNLPSDKVRIVQSMVGGAFGGKDDVVYEACGFAALGTYMTKRPCKYVASREESIISSYKRHPIKSRVTLVSDKEGNFKNIVVRNKMDGGAYASVSTFVQYRNTTHSAGPYVYNAVDVENDLYYTNNVYSAAFRGFGGLQACFFYDTIIDEMAYKLSMDPLELRLKNVWRKGTCTPTDQRVDWEPSLELVLKRLKEVSQWVEKRKEFEEFNKTNCNYKKGIGISLGYHGISLGAEGEDYAQSEVIYDKERNKLIVTCGISELGQGSRTVFSQIASEMLGLPGQYIEVNNYDTDIILDSGPTVASRGSTVGGRSVQASCENFIKFIKKEFCSLNNDPLEVKYEDGFIYQGNKKAFVMDFCKKLSDEKDIKIHGRFDMPKIDWDEHTGLGIPYIAYHFGGHVSYITVDTITGMVSVDKYFAVHDIGKVINPVTLKGQINGGIATGIGYALMEDLEIHQGIIENTNFDNYIIPTSMDIPFIYSEAIESNEPIGPFGAKGTGEPVLTPVPACIGNALRFALGKRLTDLPFSLERIAIGKELSKYDR